MQLGDFDAVANVLGRGAWVLWNDALIQVLRERGEGYMGWERGETGREAGYRRTSEKLLDGAGRALPSFVRTCVVGRLGKELREERRDGRGRRGREGRGGEGRAEEGRYSGAGGGSSGWNEAIACVLTRHQTLGCAWAVAVRT